MNCIFHNISDAMKLSVNLKFNYSLISSRICFLAFLILSYRQYHPLKFFCNSSLQIIKSFVFNEKMITQKKHNFLPFYDSMTAKESRKDKKVIKRKLVVQSSITYLYSETMFYLECFIYFNTN